MGTIREESGEGSDVDVERFCTFIGKVSCFGAKALVDAFQPPLGWEFFLALLYP
jgi:hypothetical protein